MALVDPVAFETTVSLVVWQVTITSEDVVVCQSDGLPVRQGQGFNGLYVKLITGGITPADLNTTPCILATPNDVHPTIDLDTFLA